MLLFTACQSTPQAAASITWWLLAGNQKENNMIYQLGSNMTIGIAMLGLGVRIAILGFGMLFDHSS